MYIKHSFSFSEANLQHNCLSSVDEISRTAGQQDSRTAGQQDSRTAGQQDSRTAGL
jgi:hypothetical protein